LRRKIDIMPRVLIAGCGYLGQAVADLLVADNWEVEGWTMSAESAQELSTKPYPVLAVDISQEEQVRAQKGDFDAVIHSASTRGGDADFYRRVYLDGARILLERFAGSRILFTSSTSVYSQANGEWVTEESPVEPKHDRGKILRETENLILANGGIAVRLGGIYGPGRSALLKKFLNGDAVLDPEIDRFVNQIHRDDAAEAIRFLLKRQESAGQIYNLVDDQPILQSDCYRWLATKLNRPLPPTGKSTSKRKRGESNKRVSNAKLRAIGWTPRYPTFADGMEKSVLPAHIQEET
jgi:nucleoside-diphosphate-sugar epimerase